MTFGESVSTVLSKYATFKGRASRSEYWWFFLFTFLVGIGAGILDAIFGTKEVFTTIAQLAFLLPGLAVGVRRCHDSNHSGWWVICPIGNLVMFLMPSEPAEQEAEEEK